jgi:hypothetical protein
VADRSHGLVGLKEMPDDDDRLGDLPQARRRFATRQQQQVVSSARTALRAKPALTLCPCLPMIAPWRGAAMSTSTPLALQLL